MYHLQLWQLPLLIHQFVFLLQVVIKNQLVKPIVDVLFELMSVPPEDDEKEDYFADEDDDDTPMTIANQTLDILSLHLPPEKILPHIVCIKCFCPMTILNFV